MATISYQFHAAPEELLHHLLPAWLGTAPAFLAVEATGMVNEVEYLQGAPVTTTALDPEKVRRIVVHRRPLRRALVFNDIVALNPGCLVVYPGHAGALGLRESAIGSIADDQDTLKDWRRVIRRAKKDMRRGAVAIGPAGVRVHYPTHPYTEGACELFMSGTQMLASAGEVIYELGATR
jgi:hypothetical protein